MFSSACFDCLIIIWKEYGVGDHEACNSIYLITSSIHFSQLDLMQRNTCRGGRGTAPARGRETASQLEHTCRLGPHNPAEGEE